MGGARGQPAPPRWETRRWRRGCAVGAGFLPDGSSGGPPKVALDSPPWQTGCDAGSAAILGVATLAVRRDGGAVRRLTRALPPLARALRSHGLPKPLLLAPPPCRTHSLSRTWPAAVHLLPSWLASAALLPAARTGAPGPATSAAPPDAHCAGGGAPAAAVHRRGTELHALSPATPRPAPQAGARVPARKPGPLRRAAGHLEERAALQVRRAPSAGGVRRWVDGGRRASRARGPVPASP